MSYSVQCLTCLTQWPTSYGTISRVHQRGGRMRCPRCTDLVGKTIGGLTVVRKARSGWTVHCEKGHEFISPSCNLRRAISLRTQNMYCRRCMEEARLAKPKPRPWRTHGMSKKGGAYSRWVGMWRRVRRGYTTICDQWRRFESFYADMGDPPPGTVLDRKNNALGYSPENCRWATFKLSTENRRNTVWLEIGNRRVRVTEFAERLNMKPSRVYCRLLKGETAKDILRKPSVQYMRR